MQIVQAAQISVKLAPASVVPMMPAVEIRRNVWMILAKQVIQHIKEFSFFKQNTLESFLRPFKKYSCCSYQT